MYIWLVVRAVIVGVTAHACCVLGGAQPVKNVPVGMLAGMLIKSSQARVTLIEGCWMVRRRPRRSSCSREVAYIDIRIRAVQLCCRGVRACVVAWHAARGWRMHIYICMRLRGAAPGPTSEHVRSRARYKEGVCYLYSSLYGHMSGGMRRVELTDMRHSICARL